MSTVTMDLTTQRKMIAILKIVHESHTPLGARLIADRMNSQGYVLGERAVRYHLRILDERHLTKRIGYDGRVITKLGIAEIDNALVGDRVGFIITKIERLMLETSFDLKTRQGNVIINISVIDKDDFEKTMEIIKQVILNGYPFSPYIKIFEEGTVISDIEVPRGKIGIATMCSITIDGILLKNGITSDPRYGGIMEVKDNKPVCFEDVIVYSGTTIDPCVFL
jgi:repressor of nif and glnA expression